MIEQEFALLSFVREHQPCAWVDVLNGVSCGSKTELDAVLRCCLDTHRWIKVKPIGKPPLCTIRLTPDGEHALVSELEIRSKNVADQERIERQHKHVKINTVVGILSLIVAAAGIVLTLVCR